MGYKRDGFVIRAKCYADAEIEKQWLTADVITGGLLGPLQDGGYLARVTHVSHNFAEPEPVGSIDELRRRAPTWGYDIVSLFAGDQGDPEFEIFLGLDAVGPRFAVATADADDRLREDAARWVRAWSDGLAAVRVHFATGRFEPAKRPYPRPVPPRTSLIWPPGSLDHYAGRSWHQALADRAAVLDGLEHAPLPAGARRTIEGDVVRIAFDADLQDVASVAAARAAHERWLTPLVPAEIEPGWNELGDRAVVPAVPKLREPLTVYDEQDHVGYKALVVFPEDGSIEEYKWEQVAAIARAGALPDGTPVKSVRLIFPCREDALAMHDRALANGFEMTTYPAGKVFWQVHPTDE